jgi:hypothetical protein
MAGPKVVLLKVVDGIESMAVEEEAVVVAAGPTTVTVESGAFTVSSTVGQVIIKRPLERWLLRRRRWW